MAFLNRVGNLLKHNVRKHVGSVSSASSPSLFQTIRSFSSSASPKLFVGGIDWSMEENSLIESFSQYGEVVDAKIIRDRETGRSRGFGFVTFASTEAASSAILAFDGKELHGRTVKVNYAMERPQGGGFGGGYGSGGGGGYGSGGGGGYSSGGGGFGGGYQGGNYGRGGYQGGNNSGDVGYGGGGSQYSVGGGGGYGSYGGGGYGSYGGGDPAPSRPPYTGEKPNFASLLNDDTFGAPGGNQAPQGGDEDRIVGGNEDFGPEMDENNREEDDYANTRS